MSTQITISSSVIICTRNRIKDLLRSLISLQNQTIKPDELIIVDSSDKKISELKEFQDIFSQTKFPNTKLIYKHTTPGLTKQRNEGIELSGSEIIYFFDDDVELENNYLEEMNKIYQDNPQYSGGMGCVTNINPEPSKKYKFFRKFFLLQRDYSSGKFTASGMPTHTYGRKEFLEVEVLGGCCFSFRRDIVKKYLFDEKLGYYAYMEDCDISKRISDSHKLFYNPRAKLKHFHSPLARDKVVANRAMYIKNYRYLFFKNFYPQNKLRIFCYVWSIFGLFLQALLFLNFKELRGYCRGLFASQF